MRDAHLTGDLRPEADDAVDPPVADVDEPEREREQDEAEDDHDDVRRAGRRSVSGAWENATVGGQMKFGATVGSQSGDGYGLRPSSITSAWG